MNDKTPAKPRFEVKVIKAGHTHDGKECAVGKVIEVSARQRDFLLEQKIGEALSTAGDKSAGKGA